MWSLRAKKFAFYVAFIWIIYGFVAAMMKHVGIERALIEAAMPGGLLLIAALVAYTAPRVGALLILGLGILLWVFVKQDTILKSLIVSLPLIAIGVFYFASEILDSRGK